MPLDDLTAWIAFVFAIASLVAWYIDWQRGRQVDSSLSMVFVFAMIATVCWAA